MALYIPHSIFHLARLLYVRPEAFGPYYVLFLTLHLQTWQLNSHLNCIHTLHYKLRNHHIHCPEHHSATYHLVNTEATYFSEHLYLSSRLHGVKYQKTAITIIITTTSSIIQTTDLPSSYTPHVWCTQPHTIMHDTDHNDTIKAK